MRIERLAAGESSLEWHRALAALGVAPAQIIKQRGPDSVARMTVLGRDVIVKSSGLITLGQSLKHAIGLSRAHRHWRGAAWLTAHGFATGHTLALARDTSRSPARQVLVMQRVPGPTVLERLASRDASTREQHALAAAVGELVARLANAGRYNRDHKPSNLIVEDLAKGWGGIAVIDCVALKRCSRGNRLAARWMLTTLIIEPHGCGCPPRRTLMMRGLLACLSALRTPSDLERSTARERVRPLRPPTRREKRWMWEHVAAAFHAHGNPRPRENPLGG